MEQKLKLRGKTCFLILLFAVLFCQQAIGQTIVYPSDGSDMELLAAKEVRRYIYLRTDQKLELQGVTSLPGSGELILVANDDDPMVGSLRSLINHTTNPGGFIIKTVSSGGRNILVITGNDSAATLKAAYRYAEHLGVGFGLAGDAIPDAQITLDITGFDEVGEPLFSPCGIQPFHDFPEGPDFWNTDDYMAVISQLPKLGMNFIGIHTYPKWNDLWGRSIDWQRGPEPSVWIGLPEDVNPDGTVTWSYPAYYAHTHRPNEIWGFIPWDTSNYHAGSSQLFQTNGYGSDVIGETIPTDMAGYIAVSNRAGALFNEAFTHAQNLGVKTATGTELPLGEEYDHGDTWVRGMPTELQDRLSGMSKNPADPCVVKDVYKAIFDRIMKTHPLDYYWLWSYEIWSGYEEVTADEIASFENDITTAQQALAELGNPFQIGHAGWSLGTVLPDNPAEFEDVFPSEAPFFSLLGSAIGYESLSAQRVKWPTTWMEYDFGLEQPQLAAYRVHEDALASWNKNCDGFITDLWRTRILSPTIGSMKDLNWCYGPTGTPVTKSVPSDLTAWKNAFYLDWATRQFGPQAAQDIANIFAPRDIYGGIPEPLDWTDDEVEAFFGPGAIKCNSARWSREQNNYAFVGQLEALRSQIVGAGNLERYDYWLKAFQALRIMGEYGCIRDDFEKAMNRGKYTDALSYRISMARLWEDLMTLMVEKATNASDLGEIVNLEVINWKRLMMDKWDAALEAGLGSPLPPEANPSMSYTGSAVVKATPARTQVDDGESLELKVLIMENPTSATLHYRLLGGSSYTNIALTHVARGVYEVTIPSQPDDYEYYIDAQTPIGNAVYPASAPAINQTVVVLSPSCTPETDPPEPDPMTWASEPCAVNATTISMIAITATDECAVEYFFANVTDPNHDSGWQSSTSYTDTGLSPETTYCYQVKARDKTIYQNETGWSTPPACATTPAAETEPPTPNPMTWETVPYATGENSIAMVATTASDPSGVEYYFANVTDPNHDSGWQDDPEYINTGLSSSTEYCYQVKARDKSPNQNETAWSSPEACATTLATPSWTKVDDQDASVTVYGSGWILDWTFPGAYLDTVSIGTESGDYAIFSFTGTKVRLYGCKADNGGDANIYIDSTPDGTVNFFSIEDLGDVLMYESGTLSSGPHELKVEWASSEMIYLDAFEYASAPCDPTDCHVEALNCGTATGDQGKKYGKVTVTINDDCGDPVVGADVTGTFTGDFNETLTETTDGNGQAVITTTTQVKKPTYQFCVDDVVHTLPYDPNDNIVDCCNK